MLLDRIFFHSIIAMRSAFRRCVGRRLLAVICCLVISYGFVQFVSGLLGIHMRRNAQKSEELEHFINITQAGESNGVTSIFLLEKEAHYPASTSLSKNEILLALSELIEFLEKSPGFKSEKEILLLEKECQIPKIPIWPEGIKYRMWSSTKCGSPEPIRIFKGKVYFDEKTFSCNAKTFGSQHSSNHGSIYTYIY